ncbi:hypothetical protein P153DRAFT_359221 [Dothidotthia symphoricarpi CBS 119687]|uniref:EH domain-containing protein n=1 Tax=Dothidotthia symphoricarpi CBS 119687 TaxID=1392245 RepID=A0A6A6A508_9PLEO|nr:uncharacterized protein P153DRAFT_359221 [Dothidotthia symphoricarpi CBS 119687]KAF2126890.1 hypothetical protein P153DRAFT_359221 [Dothidotthia symphoricarpi CBS 119687]
MSSARSNGLAPQSTGDTQYNVRDAALRGASLAFNKPPVKPKIPANTYTGGNNGALLAATKAGAARDSLKRDSTGGSVQSVRPAVSKSNSSSTLGVPNDNLDRSPSPSNIAARLAAARFSPMKPMSQAPVAPARSARDADEGDGLPPTGSVGNVLARLDPKKPAQQPRKRRDSFGSRSAATLAQPPHTATDDTPIPPTTSRVSMFEQNRPTTSSQHRPTTPLQHPAIPLIVSHSSSPPVKSPKPQRTFQLPPEPAQFTDGAKDLSHVNLTRVLAKSPPITPKPAQLASIKTRTPPPPKPPPQRGSRPRPASQDLSRSTPAHRRLSTSLESHDTPPSPASFKSAKEEQDEDDKPKPSLPPPRRSASRKVDEAPPEIKPKARPQPTTPLPIKSRNQDQLSSPIHPPEYFSPHLSAQRRPTSAMSLSPGSVYHNNYQRNSVKEITKHMTGESLSSAIVGAALASSRNVSPAPSPMPIEPFFPPRKHHHTPFGRSPSPPKQSPPKATGKLRTTMRKDPSSSDDEDETDKYKRKGTRIMGFKGRKHPNKHQEGERKRWRDQITDRERKRYEGVWAANKGLYLPEPSPSHAPVGDDPSQDVVSLIVKDIWSRSRLPEHVLEEVWSLVDSRGVGRLKRDEFVVGLWLIDQRLKGRKLPPRVSESVIRSSKNIIVRF